MNNRMLNSIAARVYKSLGWVSLIGSVQKELRQIMPDILAELAAMPQDKMLEFIYKEKRASDED